MGCRFGKSKSDYHDLETELKTSKERIERLQRQVNAGSKAEADNEWGNPIFANAMIALVWPYATGMAMKIVREIVEPQINAQMPKALGEFHLCPDDGLGDIPVEISMLSGKMEEQEIANAKGERIKSQNMVLSATVMWDADVSLDFEVSTVNLRITRIMCQGDMTIKLVQMHPDGVPLFRGIRAFFANRPEMSFNIEKGDGGGRKSFMLGAMLNSGVVKKTILDVVATIMGDLLVLPNRIGIALDKTVDVFDMSNPVPEGLLRLTVWKANNIVGADSHLFGNPTSDPYLQVSCGCLTFKSATQMKTINPVFNYHVPLIISASAQQKVFLEMFDYDMANKDDFLGKLSIPVRELMKLNGNEKEFQICDEDGDPGQRGTMRISAHWAPTTTDADKAVLHAMCMVSVGFYKATGIHCCEETLAWCEVEVTNCLPGRPGGNTDKTFERPEMSSSAIQTSKGEWHEKMAVKIEKLKQHGVPENDIAEVLEIPEERMQEFKGEDATTKVVKGRSTTRNLTARPHAFQWNNAFDFILESADSATVTLALWTRGLVALGKDGEPDPTGTKFEERKICRGKHVVSLDEFKKDPQRKMVEWVTLEGHANLKYRIRLLFFDTPVHSTADDWVKTMQQSGHLDWIEAGQVDGGLDDFLNARASQWQAVSDHHFEGEDPDPVPEVVVPVKPEAGSNGSGGSGRKSKTTPKAKFSAGNASAHPPHKTKTKSHRELMRESAAAAN